MLADIGPEHCPTGRSACTLIDRTPCTALAAYCSSAGRNEAGFGGTCEVICPVMLSGEDLPPRSHARIGTVGLEASLQEGLEAVCRAGVILRRAA